jgi:hypothetical protein
MIVVWVAAVFSAGRMLDDYLERIYAPKKPLT